MWKKILFLLAFAALWLGSGKVFAQDPVITEVMVLPPEPTCGNFSRIGVIVNNPGPAPYALVFRRSNFTQFATQSFQTLQDTFILDNISDISLLGAYPNAQTIFSNDDNNLGRDTSDLEIYRINPSINPNVDPVFITNPSCAIPDSMQIEIREFRRGLAPFLAYWIINPNTGNPDTVIVDVSVGTGANFLKYTFPIPSEVYGASTLRYRIFGTPFCGSDNRDLDTEDLPPSKGIRVESKDSQNASTCGGDGVLEVELDDIDNYTTPFSINVGGTTIQSSGTSGDVLSFDLPTGSYNGITVVDGDGCIGSVPGSVAIFDPVPPEIAGESLEIIPGENCTATGNFTLSIISDYSGEGPLIAFLDGQEYPALTETVNGSLFVGINDVPQGTYNQIILEDDMTSCRDTLVFASARVIAPENAPVLDPFTQDTITICANDTAEVIGTADGGTGALTFIWTLPDNSTLNQDSISLTAGGEYTLTVTDSVGCASTQALVVNTLALPTLIYNPSRVVQVQTDSPVTVTWTASVPNVQYSYAWSVTDPGNVGPIDTTGSDSVIFETYTLAEGTSQSRLVYVIDISDGQCSTADSIEITILRDTGPANFIIPDVFTPNGDGANDIWDIRYPVSLDPTTFRVQVYNRAGGLVHDQALSTPWDGANLPDGPYFYIITNTADGSASPLRGAVSIIRRQP